MTPEKQKAFVTKMRKKRLSLVKRKNFDGGGLAGLLGGGGGSGGTGFSINPGATQDQINNSYNRNQTALTGQENLANTLTPQVGTAVANQNTLSGQYADQSAGRGPNVAQTMLNQQTGSNVANQAALMSGQRGASANPALLAREAAQQGASTQQQAAGQAATMQAEQQIAAEQAQAQLAGNQISQAQGATTAATQANQGEQGVLQGANTAYNNVQGGLANTTSQGQQGMLGGLINAGGGALASMLSEGGEVHGPKKLDFIHKMTKLGMEHYHERDVTPKKMADGGQMTSPGLAVPTVNYQAPQTGFQGSSPAQGGFAPTSNLGEQAISDSFKAKDTKSGSKAGGGDSLINGLVGKIAKPVMDYIGGMGSTLGGGAMEGASQLGGAAGAMETGATSAEGAGALEGLGETAVMVAAHGGKVKSSFDGPHKSHIANYLMAKGGKVPALVSPGEIRLTKEQVKQVVENDVDPGKIGMKYGGKAKVKGDSKRNDIIPDDLEDGDVIIDREHVMSPEKRKLFVHKAIAKGRVK